MHGTHVVRPHSESAASWRGRFVQWAPVRRPLRPGGNAGDRDTQSSFRFFFSNFHIGLLSTYVSPISNFLIQKVPSDDSFVVHEGFLKGDEREHGKCWQSRTGKNFFPDKGSPCAALIIDKGEKGGSYSYTVRGRRTYCTGEGGAFSNVCCGE